VLFWGGRWTDYVEDVVNKYNNSVHNSTDFKPSILGAPENEYNWLMQKRAYNNQMRKAQWPNRRETLKVGDRVKLRIKPKGLGSYKETNNSWSKEVYPVSEVEAFQNEGTLYHLQNYRRPLLRYELLKIDDVQNHVAGELRSVLKDVQRPKPPPNFSEPNAPKLPKPSAPVNRPRTRSTSNAVHIPSAGGSSGSREPAMPPPAMSSPLSPEPVPAAVRTPITPNDARAALVIRRPTTQSRPLIAPAAARETFITRRPVTRSQTR
jgi:hypothetical protein